jgi:hypothetical protein
MDFPLKAAASPEFAYKRRDGGCDRTAGTGSGDPARPSGTATQEGAAAAITGPAIVTAASKRDRAIRRREEADDGQEASPGIKAFFTRIMRPPGA